MLLLKVCVFDAEPERVLLLVDDVDAVLVRVRTDAVADAEPVTDVDLCDDTELDGVAVDEVDTVPLRLLNALREGDEDDDGEAASVTEAEALRDTRPSAFVDEVEALVDPVALGDSES